MEISNDQAFIEKTQLLDLNQYCLMEIFQRLELLDYVNLASTCRHLRDVSNAVSVVKYKQIVVDAHDNHNADKKLSMHQFSNVMSVIGEHILEVEIHWPNHFGLASIRDNCKKLNSLKLLCCTVPVQLQEFCNLRELQVQVNYEITNNEWRTIFANNADLEILDYVSNKYEKGFVELLATLPHLKSLHFPMFLPRSFHQSQELEQLLRLDGLSKLSLQSDENCNETLIKVADKLKLVELDIRMIFNGDSLEIFRSFLHLEVLSIFAYLNFNEDWLSDANVLPPSLKRVKIDHARISCRNFMSIVYYLKFLDEFDLGYFGRIFLDQHKPIIRMDSRVISRIEDGLRRNRRTLKIIHYDRNSNDSFYTHKSSHLTIINKAFGYVCQNQSTLRSTQVDI